jgi:hypothetical protein
LGKGSWNKTRPSGTVATTKHNVAVLIATTNVTEDVDRMKKKNPKEQGK